MKIRTRYNPVFGHFSRSDWGPVTSSTEFWTQNGCLVAHKWASSGDTKYDQDIFTQVNKRTDYYDVPRRTSVNKVSIFPLYGPTKYYKNRF